MKRFALVLLATLGIVGCNTDGFEELPSVYVRNNYPNGAGSSGASSDGFTGMGAWVYTTTEDSNNQTFVARATTSSLADYTDLDNNKVTSGYLEMKRAKYTDKSTIEQSVTIYGGTGAKLDCTPSCKVTTGGKVFIMTNSTEPFITGIDAATNAGFYELMTKNGNAVITVPVKNTKNGSIVFKYDANNFDKDKMKLHGE
ncbi:hypothetical protein MOXK02_19140 [Moraxella sp. K02]